MKKEKRIAEQKSGVWGLVKKFVGYYKPYRKLFIFDLACVILTLLGELAFPKLVELITNDARTQLQLSLSLVIKVSVALLGLRLIEIASRFFITKYGHMMGAYIERDLREKMFSHLQKLSHAYYDNVKVGTLMSRISTDLFEITEFAHHCPEEFFIAGIKIIGIFTILMFSNIYLTLCIFAILPFMIWVAVIFNGKMRATFKANRVQMGELNAVVEDSLSGIRVVKSFTNEKLEGEKFATGNTKFLKIKNRNYTLMATYSCITRAIDALMYVMIIILSAVFKVDVNVFITYLLYATILLSTVKSIADYTEQFQKGMTAFDRYVEIVETPVTIADSFNAITLSNVEGTILFKDVTFSYSEDTRKVLDGFNMRIDRGETLAIVGPSGAGKTTIANLIPRFYEINSGKITIDDINIQDVTLESLRNSIGVVQQDVYLFWGTVLDNIRYGKLDATREEVIEAAKLAGADEFIEKMPLKYDSYVGERGVKLSGGQKQRISIARVFLKNPPIIILDEATSALDNESEVVVQRSLDRLSKGRTAIIIAHRLSTIRNAKSILVLTEKGVVEKGSHEQLMEKDGLYKKLYSLSVSTEKFSV